MGLAPSSRAACTRWPPLIFPGSGRRGACTSATLTCRPSVCEASPPRRAPPPPAPPPPPGEGGGGRRFLRLLLRSAHCRPAGRRRHRLRRRYGDRELRLRFARGGGRL